MITSESNKFTGYSPEAFRRLITKEWQLPAEAINCLRSFFLRKWHTDNLLALIKEGCINYEGHKYQVIWKGGKVEATKAELVSMSFRLTYGTVMPTVLVKTTVCVPHLMPVN